MARIGFADLPCVQTCRSVEKWKNGAKDGYVFRKRFVYKRNMLMYEGQSMDTYYLVYSYYDIEDGKLINEIEIRR